MGKGGGGTVEPFGLLGKRRVILEYIDERRV